jgi:hypothetical protein
MILVEELIAPEFVEFYDAAWNEIGTKASLCEEIALITEIDPLILRGSDPRKRSIAERMSWAASRATSRVEDVAYCLMGLFDVNMPMLYGEGTRAFIRLQEEIIRRTEDYTIFAWTADPINNMPRGLFASFPADFKLSGRSFVANPDAKWQKPKHSDAGSKYIRVSYQHEQPPSLTSRGLLVTLPCMSMVRDSELGPDAYLAWICSINSERTEDHAAKELVICIALQELEHSKPKKFVRLHPRHLYLRQRSLFAERFTPRTMYALASGKPENTSEFINTKPQYIGSGSLTVDTSLRFRSLQINDLESTTSSVWNTDDQVLSYSYGSELSGVLAKFEFQDAYGTFQVHVEFRQNLPCCFIKQGEHYSDGANLFFPSISDRATLIDSRSNSSIVKAVIRPTPSHSSAQNQTMFKLFVYRGH